MEQVFVDLPEEEWWERCDPQNAEYLDETWGQHTYDLVMGRFARTREEQRPIRMQQLAHVGFNYIGATEVAFGPGARAKTHKGKRRASRNWHGTTPPLAS